MSGPREVVATVAVRGEPYELVVGLFHLPCRECAFYENPTLCREAPSTCMDADGKLGVYRLIPSEPNQGH